MDFFYDRINDYSAVSIKLASPEEIRSWSFGEVKKPETINYRTYKPEKDGLFCERIFGPEKDWECFCGKFKGIKYKGVVCDRCGVEITTSRVRRKRMGHISLTAPIVHIWFLKTIPSRIGTLLGIKSTALERVAYYQDYIVTELTNKACPLKERQLLTEEEYRNYKERFPNDFTASMGAEAVRLLLSKLDLPKLSKQLKEELKKTSSAQKTKEIIKRLRMVEMFLDSENKPEWMILNVIPVIPPDLRPLVLLESGNFATSDLNDLYRRLINRNNRLKKLMDLNAPEVIIRNEKRMLQQSVDALFDNSRCRRPVLGTNNRPLKSLTDMIKGKQGRFRENLLGKRVDYSARAVIVVGPELKLHQCGLPKKIALELYQPFIIRRLKELGKADTIKSAKKMLDRREEVVWDILDEIIKGHPVMLNRAPTLHRLSIQAFEPVLVEGNAIRVHPLVCAGFNADFDGDQMAVHLPLSWEAQIEAKTLIMSVHNIFSPAHGNPSMTPTQDMVMGLNYLTLMIPGRFGEGKSFSSPKDAIYAYEHGFVNLHSRVTVSLDKPRCIMTSVTGESSAPQTTCQTTAGRLLLDEALPPGMSYYNSVMEKKSISQLIHECYKMFAKEVTLKFLDDLKELGFKYATISGLSLSRIDLRVPDKKAEIIKVAEDEVDKIYKNFRKGLITDGERYNQIIDCWTHAREKVGEAMMLDLKNDTRDGRPYINPIFLMASSGARGSTDQVRQLCGMRGLMAKPSGEIIETPIKANFKEGLSVLEYFSSTHGARKGLADTALKTADAGYLTRKLVDVCQNMVISMDDCGTLNGITKSVIYKGDKISVPLSQSLYGRSARDNIIDVVTDEVVVEENQIITEAIAKKIEGLGHTKIRVRSPLTCEASQGVCAKCYGMDLSAGKLAENGLAAGIIAAQSIGEPGTQLTMRTFHIGGIAFKTVEESQIVAKNAGVIKFNNLVTAVNTKGETVVINRNGEILVNDNRGREIERYVIPPGSTVFVQDDQKIKPGTSMVKWDPHNIPILAEKSGKVVYEDILKNVTMHEEVESKTGITRKVIIEHKGDMRPQIVVKDAKGAILAVYPLPEKTHIEVGSGDEVQAGAVLAKTPREITGTQDITGGLPRVTELFEARRPKDPAVISELDGVIVLGEKHRGKRTIIVRNEESGMEKEHLVLHGQHLRVHSNDRVRAGEALVEGPLVPHDILRVSGEEALQNYLLGEVQSVYRSQNVGINDKHIELIISQMTKKVKVVTSGDSKFLPGTVVDKFKFKEENASLKKASKKPATAKPLLLGITKAALMSDSFIAAASFQETTRILTEAAMSGKRDELVGLKENVILGHMIPAGTGYPAYFNNSKLEKVFSELMEEHMPEEADETPADSKEEPEEKSVAKAKAKKSEKTAKAKKTKKSK
ncbi:MAG: DNA-directed RNA polymerase subunit beta' [Planctomycetes bacterium]|nr:DNA-directed RNA polymerase subunit beta' [Planctomycetota bacterium]